MLRYLPLILFVSLAGFAQTEAAKPSDETPSTPRIEAAGSQSLTQDQIRQLVRQVAEKDMENDKRQRDYTYVQREEEHHLNGKGEVQSTEIRTKEVMVVYGEQVERLIAKDDKPLSEKDAAKEDERVQKIIDKRKNESDEQRAKRLKEEEKDQEEARKFVSEVADAYNFTLVGIEPLDGRETYAIDAEPRPGFQPHVKGAQFLPKFRFRVWIDKEDVQWRKLDLECIDTVTFGLLLFRMHKGAHATVEQTRVNDEVWLQRRIVANVDFRLALMKNFDLSMDISDGDYKKFRSSTTFTPLGETGHQ